MNWQILLITLFFSISFLYKSITKEPSVARLWNEALLNSIRMDYARPTVHARNLFHTSIAMYDAWSLFNDKAETYLIGKTVGDFSCPYSEIDIPGDLDTFREKVISYSIYRILRHRFRTSPGARKSIAQYNLLMKGLGYDPSLTSTDYKLGSPEALGNYIGQCVIDFGLQDGANEKDWYKNRHYKPVNPPLDMTLPGNPSIVDPNHWQPLSFEVFIDQSGNVFKGATPEFVGPEWGGVSPFALKDTDLKIYERDGYQYKIYHNPGPPPFLNNSKDSRSLDHYKWGFAMVSIWSSHLDPSDNVIWDISPRSIGNIQKLPQKIEEYQEFYDFFNGGDNGKGHVLNPHTGKPYKSQLVPRGDYVRALAEFWADGPDSETPPGHWFTILNYVNDHPEFKKRFRGKGPVLDALEWDVKSYFVLGGAVHDAAIAAWGLKGWYDYIRPISALRNMADRGQNTDTKLPRYHSAGIPLYEGFIEIVREGDLLEGENGEHRGKIKLYTWKGPEHIKNPDNDTAGVGWILAEKWWPYQRPSFVTPPFAGYVSGHSTYSRAAAEVMTLLTGDKFFPGGLGEFIAKKEEFLVFEDGPSVDLTLEWATYRDASDQCSLSRIWGGIHPPADDIPGRLIGEKVGINAFQYAELFFMGINQTE